MTDCIEWTGPRMANGYGRVNGQRRTGTWLAHRHVYEETLGEIPAGRVLHHRCENKLCVNPEHLEAIERPDHTGGLGHGKLTRAAADEVKAYLGAGWRGLDVAEMFGVSKQQVCNIKNGRCWA